MKKTILLSAFVLGALSLQAQTALQGTNFSDNWSIGLVTGSTAKITNSKFTKSMRPAMGLEINKQVTPVLGLSIQGLGYVNTTGSKTAIDATDLSMLGRINLMNLFAWRFSLSPAETMKAVSPRVTRNRPAAIRLHRHPGVPKER